MKNWKRGVCAGMTAVMCASVWSVFLYKPGTALGASPEFGQKKSGQGLGTMFWNMMSLRI